MKDMAAISKMMGWWRPFFFSNVTGVQLLLPGVQLSSGIDLLWAMVLIFVLSISDKLLEAFARDSDHKGLKSLLAAGHQMTHYILMLLAMTFNVWIFAILVACSGVAEYTMLRLYKTSKKSYELVPAGATIEAV